MPCRVDLHYLLYYRNNLHCDMPEDWNGEISLFVPSLLFSQLCQPDQKKQFIKKLLSNSEYGISETKDKFPTTTAIIFFNNSKMHCTYFNPLMPGGSKRSNILKKTYSQKLLFILSIYGLCYYPAWEC